MAKQRTIEFTFTNFQNEFNEYNQNIDLILAETNNKRTTNKRISQLMKLFGEFQNLDVKIRLAFGISEIRLDNNFVSSKEGDLKICHLLYYKLADLWFAYETYQKFFTMVVGTGKNKIVWLDDAVHNQYATSTTIVAALNSVNVKFRTTYDTNPKRNELIEYIEYCELQATNRQHKQRLTGIILKVKNTPITLTHTEILTLIYAIRNNFVHNGETTVVPDNFGFRNKSQLLKILYPYLCLVLLKSINITCRRV